MRSRLGMTLALGVPLRTPLPKVSAQTAALGRRIQIRIRFSSLSHPKYFAAVDESHFNPKLGLNVTPCAMIAGRLVYCCLRRNGCGSSARRIRTVRQALLSEA